MAGANASFQNAATIKCTFLFFVPRFSVAGIRRLAGTRSRLYFAHISSGSVDGASMVRGRFHDDVDYCNASVSVKNYL